MELSKYQIFCVYYVTENNNHKIKVKNVSRFNN